MEENESEAINFAKTYFEKNLLLDFVTENYKRSVKEGDYSTADALIDAANSENLSTLDHDAIIAYAAAVLREPDELMPYPIAKYVADFLENKRQRPTKRGKDPYKNWERDFKLRKTTQAVIDKYNFPAYANNELFYNITAVQIVSKATGFSENIVTDVYKKFKKSARGK